MNSHEIFDKIYHYQSLFSFHKVVCNIILQTDAKSREHTLDNIMTVRGQSITQRVKIQQSIKEAKLLIGTAQCLLPDGTGEEVRPYPTAVVVFYS